jgi:2-C-methyl-D-erythritol 2,4-cyclodiphosphate synthase
MSIWRVGLGYDIHRLAAGRRLMLGGIEIPHDRGLEGHSDADVVCHALADAILGALSLGDIGRHFPPTDSSWRDADSVELLTRVVALATSKGARVANADVTVVAEAPRLAPHADRMRERLAPVLGVATGAVSVKATTNEGLGPEGRGEAISAHAVCLLQLDHA